MTSLPPNQKQANIPGFQETKKIYNAIVCDRNHLVSGLAYSRVLHLKIIYMRRVAYGKFECLAIDKPTQTIQTLQYEVGKKKSWQNKLISPLSDQKVYDPQPINESLSFDDLFLKIWSGLDLSVTQQSGARHSGTVTTVHRKHHGFVIFALQREGRGLVCAKRGYRRLLLYNVKTYEWSVSRVR